MPLPVGDKALVHSGCRILSDPYAEPFYLKLGARRIGEVASPMEGAPSRTLPLMEWRAPAASA
jgi:hypothetical protein